MNDQKNPLASMGIWGAIFGIALGLAPLVAPLIGEEPSALGATLTSVGVAVAGGIALIGRLRARHILKF